MVINLVFVGVLFLVAEAVGPKTQSAIKLGPLGALGIGLAQAAALVPGVSRSGATITCGLFLGLRREEAARFSFLMSVPVTAAAAGLSLAEAAGEAWTLPSGDVSGGVGLFRGGWLLGHQVPAWLPGEPLPQGFRLLPLRLGGRGGGGAPVFRFLTVLIHRSAWKGNSRTSPSSDSPKFAEKDRELAHIGDTHRSTLL